MKHQHKDIAGKRFTYVQLDESFYYFTENECDYYDAESLLDVLEETIAADHGRATPLNITDHPRIIWELDNEYVTFRYQLLPGIVEVGPIWSKKTGVCFEPAHDLLAEFTR